jgi:hypothetical protein
MPSPTLTAARKRPVCTESLILLRPGRFGLTIQVEDPT